MENNSEKTLVDRAQRYSEFSGILIGFSITIAVLIIALANEEIAKQTLYIYSLSAFIYSALAFFNAYTWLGRATEKSPKTSGNSTKAYKEESVTITKNKSKSSKRQCRALLIGAFFYNTAYWGIILGLIYLTSLITSQTLNYPFLIALGFLAYTFTINMYEFVWEIIADKGITSHGIILLALLIMAIIFSVLTIPVEPLLAILDC
jgi:hypothetical protein